ncbi:reverse transcriptase domain-containing protein [Tanacetum coccineum]|uniref:Reverse transcriptase domain-containing protein n=1 Tax=Tanacetum coccineum TaxID=301880 RepID=A0ABQ5IPA1_9ASTR
MPPRMTTRSAGQETAAPQGGRTGGRTSRGGGRTRVLNFSTIIAQQLQNLLPTILAQVGDQGSNHGNGRNQNSDAVNDNIQGDVRNVIASNNQREKMESVQDMSRGEENQKVKYTAGSFVSKAFTWWNSLIHTRSREAVVGMSWKDFKNLTREEFYPSNEMQKLETELWNHAMVGAGHAALMTSNNVYFIASFTLLIMEYLVNISKRRAFWSLNKDILKITILTTNTPYPSRKIRRIHACTHQRPQRKQAQYAVSREDQYVMNILEDIKHGPYSKKLQYAISNPLDTPYRTDFQIDILIRASRLKKVMEDKGKKSSMETFTPNDKAYYYSGITSITVNGKNAYELKGKFLNDLHNNAFSGTNGKDAVDHIEYYLKIIVPSNQILM